MKKSHSYSFVFLALTACVTSHGIPFDNPEFLNTLTLNINGIIAIISGTLAITLSFRWLGHILSPKKSRNLAINTMCQKVFQRRNMHNNKTLTQCFKEIDELSSDLELFITRGGAEKLSDEESSKVTHLQYLLSQETQARSEDLQNLRLYVEGAIKNHSFPIFLSREERIDKDFNLYDDILDESENGLMNKWKKAYNEVIKTEKPEGLLPKGPVSGLMHPVRPISRPNEPIT